jgi:hypothetical protein
MQYLGKLKNQAEDMSLSKKQRDRAFTLASTAQLRLTTLRQNIASRIQGSIVSRKINLSGIAKIPKFPEKIYDPDAIIELDDWLKDIKKVR